MKKWILALVMIWACTLLCAQNTTEELVQQNRAAVEHAVIQADRCAVFRDARLSAESFKRDSVL